MKKSRKVTSATLGVSSFLMINLKLLAVVNSSDAIILLSYLISKRDYYFSRGDLGEEEAFFLTQDRISSDIKLSVFMIQHSMKTLLKHKLITVEKRGLPARNFFTVDDDRILELLEK